MAPSTMTSPLFTVTPSLRLSPQNRTSCLHSTAGGTCLSESSELFRKVSYCKQHCGVHQRDPIIPSRNPLRVEAAAKKRNSRGGGGRRRGADVAEEQLPDSSAQPSSSSATTSTLPTGPSPSTSASSPPPSPLPSQVSSSAAGAGYTQGTPEGAQGGAPAVAPAPAPREEVLRACVTTSAGLAAVGLLLRQLSSWGASSGLPVNDCNTLLPFSVLLSGEELGATALAVALVSGARVLLLSLSPSFAAASDRSNAQVLTLLFAPDIVAVASLPGLAEELLFRGAVLPLVGVNWLGVLVAGSVFGTLHLTGDRNAVFAAWASGVGIVYGCLLLSTNNLACPMIAHSLANMAAAFLWKSKQKV